MLLSVYYIVKKKYVKFGNIVLECFFYISLQGKKSNKKNTLLLL